MFIAVIAVEVPRLFSCLQLDNQCKELMRKLDTVQHQLAGEKERADAADSNLKKKLEQVYCAVN